MYLTRKRLRNTTWGVPKAYAFFNIFIFPLTSHYDRAIMTKLLMMEDTLTPYLEEEYGFSLILHERDFPGGVTIMANIINAVEKTRRMIMILTK